MLESSKHVTMFVMFIALSGGVHVASHLTRCVLNWVKYTAMENCLQT